MHTAAQIAQEIVRYDLVTVDREILDASGADPLDWIVRSVMVRRGGGAFRDLRMIVSTARALADVPDGIDPHPAYAARMRADSSTDA